jgi:hypothetical protein
MSTAKGVCVRSLSGDVVFQGSVASLEELRGRVALELATDEMNLTLLKSDCALVWDDVENEEGGDGSRAEITVVRDSLRGRVEALVATLQHFSYDASVRDDEGLQELLRDKRVVMAALPQTYLAFHFASREVRNDPKVREAVVIAAKLR